MWGEVPASQKVNINVEVKVPSDIMHPGYFLQSQMSRVSSEASHLNKMHNLMDLDLFFLLNCCGHGLSPDFCMCQIKTALYRGMSMCVSSLSYFFNA